MEKISNPYSKSIVLVDFGAKYTKVGFVGESVPRGILATPSGIFNIDDIPVEGDDPTKTVIAGNMIFATAIQNEGEFKFKIEEFLWQIFYRELLINAKDKTIFVCENVLLTRFFYETIVQVLMTKFNVAKVYVVPSLTLPLYLTSNLKLLPTFPFTS